MFLKIIREAMHKLIRRMCHPRFGQRFTAGGQEYEFHGAIGNGAVGLVRKARNLKTGDTVAVKVLAPDPKYIDLNAFEDVQQRFKREGVRGARLHHENLVRIIAYEDNEAGSCFKQNDVKNPFLVMEYISGKTLESLIRKMTPSSGPCQTQISKHTLFIAHRLALALTHLHDHKIIHRDVKPANIFLSSATVGSTPSVVKLGDFGVTKWGDFLASAASGTLTVTRQQGLGTLKYMSPEQAVRPKEVTVRSDMFSLGITLFELFTGQILPSQHHVFEIMTARNSHESLAGKLIRLGIKFREEELGILQMVLDMFLTSPKGRPTSSTLAGRMDVSLERWSADQRS